MKQTSNELKIDNETLNRADNVKFLGIRIDEALSWADHIEYCRRKVSCGLFALNAVKKCLLTDNLKMLYHSLIHPYLTYGIMLWGSAYKTHLHKLAVIQKKAVRCITNSKFNEHSAPLFAKLQIPTLSDIYMIELHVGKFVYLVNNKQIPEQLQEIYTQNNDIYNYYTHNISNFHMHPIKIDVVFRSFIYQGPSMWHKLPETIKQSRTVARFGSKLKKMYISEYQ